MQFQADMIGIPVVRPGVTETTALGAAYLAGLSTGVWPDVKALSRLPQRETRFEPRMPRPEAQRLRERWKQAVSRSKSWEAAAPA
jgi:glycerol kinase